MLYTLGTKENFFRAKAAGSSSCLPKPRLKASEMAPPFPERLYGVGTYSPPTRRHIPEDNNCQTAAINSNLRRRSLVYVKEEDSPDDQNSDGGIGLWLADSKTFCSMSRIDLVTARPGPQR